MTTESNPSLYHAQYCRRHTKNPWITQTLYYSMLLFVWLRYNVVSVWLCSNVSPRLGHANWAHHRQPTFGQFLVRREKRWTFQCQVSININWIWFYTEKCDVYFVRLLNVTTLTFRIRTEKNGGAWCPREPVSRDSYEWLQVDFNQLTVISLVETQGRFGNGQVMSTRTVGTSMILET